MVTIAVLALVWKIEELALSQRTEGVTEKLYSLQGKTLAATSAENRDLQAKLQANIQQAPKGVTRSIVLAYLSHYFGKQAPVAERIFTCESGLRPEALGQNTNGTQDRGVAQINSVHARQFEQVTGVPYEIGAHDTNLNIQFAAWMYNRQGNFSAWVCSRIVGVQA